MAKFVLLANWTESGLSEVEETTDRAVRAAELIKSFDGEMTQVYWTLGAYDLVAILEAPSADRVAAFTLALGKGGSVRTITLPAFDRDAIGHVIDGAKLHGGSGTGAPS